ncbi:putative bifunctional diguanylate cyclase/phosphodiesterase [Mumia sp. Pv 4-285]|uniref:putative bifunctional diguanylate cyclase/phosphodiesterase n=1 Tax=Mumia qirimensis TaxID=3234852 RepID=UPI00351D8130
MTAAPRPASRLLTVGIVVAALVVTVGTVVAAAADRGVPNPWWLLTIPAIMLASSAPLYLDRYDDWLVVGTESCVLVLLALTLQWQDALLLWIVGIALAQCLPVARGSRLFNAARSIVAGAVAVGVLTLLDDGMFGLREVVAVVLAFTLAFLVDIGASVLRIRASGPPGAGSLESRAYEILTLYAVYAGVTAMGYVAVLLYRTESPSALLAVVPALAIVLVAAKGVTRERETARRLNVLFETANALHSAATEKQVLAVLDAGTRQLGKSPGSGLRTDLPGATDLRRLIIAGDDVYWLVIEGKRGPQASTLRNVEALESIAQQAEEALSRMRMNRDLVANAQRDPLTKLRNRSVFLATVAEVMAGGPEGDAAPCAILFCDLDGFKKVNDQFGHASGDGALIAIARRLADELPDEVHVARLGGDEFAILIGTPSDSSEDAAAYAARIAEDVRAIVARPILVDNRTIDITVSIGIASTDDAPASADQLLRNADIAMYVAKREGRDRIVVYHDAMGIERVRSLELADRLRRAIEERRLRVVYQPIVAADDERILAVEALARWTEDGEVVSPEEFIPLAEEANLIEAIGRFVLEQVCDDREQLDQALEPETAIAVNLSARQLGSRQFVSSVLRAVEVLAPHPLTLEITETESISEDVIESRVMEDLVARGAVLAVDDFGVGFSSLERLMRLPVQVLKLDRIFSRDIDTDESRGAFLDSMLEMASAVNLRVVVEGIERLAQVDAVLADRGSDSRRSISFQGYYFGGPMSPATLVRWAAQRERTSSLRRS